MEKNTEQSPNLNALKHGGRSKQTVLPNEKQEEFDALNAAWRAEFSMEGQAAESLLQRVIENEWLMRRAERNYSAVEEALASINPLEWTLEQHKKLELFARYKTTAERAFSRFFNMLRGWRKDKFREDWSLENVHKIVNETVARLLRERAEAAEQEEREGSTERDGEAGDFERAEERVLATFSSERDGKQMRKASAVAPWMDVTGRGDFEGSPTRLGGR